MLVTSTFNSLRWLLILVYPQTEKKKKKKLCTRTGNYSFELWPITQAPPHVSSNHVWRPQSSGYGPSDMTKCDFNPLNFSELSKTHPRILLINQISPLLFEFGIILYLKIRSFICSFLNSDCLKKNLKIYLIYIYIQP